MGGSGTSLGKSGVEHKGHLQQDVMAFSDKFFDICLADLGSIQESSGRILENVENFQEPRHVMKGGGGVVCWGGGIPLIEN